MLLLYYANNCAWLECLFGGTVGAKTGKMPHWGRGLGEDQPNLEG